jgi:hypothetical protein
VVLLFLQYCCTKMVEAAPVAFGGVPVGVCELLCCKIPGVHLSQY